MASEKQVYLIHCTVRGRYTTGPYPDEDEARWARRLAMHPTIEVEAPPLALGPSGKLEPSGEAVYPPKRPRPGDRIRHRHTGRILTWPEDRGDILTPEDMPRSSQDQAVWVRE